jgi:hypothetical protein
MKDLMELVGPSIFGQLIEKQVRGGKNNCSAGRITAAMPASASPP